MRKLLVLTVALLLAVSSSFAADFKPVLLKISASPLIQYDFTGGELEIPVQVSGTNAGVVLSVYTRGMADQVGATTNGHLGWHYVNKVDTCIYYSPLRSLAIGANTITWNGKDQDGGTVPPGEYTYYLWAYDNVGAKQKMCEYLGTGWMWERGSEIIGVDEAGLPSSHPIFYELTKRWIIGNDPYDQSLMETTAVPLGTGWSIYGDAAIDPSDFDFFYLHMRNKDAKVQGISRFKWVPGGESELQTDFGEQGYSELANYLGGLCPGVNTDGEYLYMVDENYITDNEPNADFYIYDYDGLMVTEIDISPWWSSPDDFENGGQMNGGPNTFSQRNGYVFLSSNGSCLVQMVDPKGYLETDDIEDFIIWGNDNGDYVLDRNFEDTAERAWVCNDYNAGVFKECASADDNLFFTANAYDAGAVSFGLLGPDGTSFGYFSFSGETAGWKMGQMFLDDDTPYDGIYTDNRQAGGTHYQEGGWQANEYTSGLYFIAHDSITGVITDAVDVAQEAPAEFLVEQNMPNPFNPTTTIDFTLAVDGEAIVEIFNAAGQKVATLVDGYISAGKHSVVWDASAFSSGVYFYTVKSGGISKTMKMTLMK